MLKSLWGRKHGQRLLLFAWLTLSVAESVAWADAAQLTSGRKRCTSFADWTPLYTEEKTTACINIFQSYEEMLYFRTQKGSNVSLKKFNKAARKRPVTREQKYSACRALQWALHSEPVAVRQPEKSSKSTSSQWRTERIICTVFSPNYFIKSWNQDLGITPPPLNRGLFLNHKPFIPNVCRQAGHQDLAERLVEIQYELTDRLTFYLCGRRPGRKHSCCRADVFLLIYCGR